MSIQNVQRKVMSVLSELNDLKAQIEFLQSKIKNEFENIIEKLQFSQMDRNLLVNFFEEDLE
ncbi:MAG: hypothetical protein QXU81_00085 [Candidatus Bathyarchaeia archaeon]